LAISTHPKLALHPNYLTKTDGGLRAAIYVKIAEIEVTG